MNYPHIPVLRQGKQYESLEKTEVKSIRTGETVAIVSQANAGMIKRDMRGQSRSAYKGYSVQQLVEISARAGELFMTADLPFPDGHSQTPSDYMNSLSHTSGLPISLIKRNMAKINQVFTEMSVILKGLTRGLDLDVIDAGTGLQNGVVR